MARPAIERIELHKHLFLNEFCAEIFITGDPQPVARVDNSKQRFTSTLATRLAGVDSLLNGLTLAKLTNHPKTVVNPSRADSTIPARGPGNAEVTECECCADNGESVPATVLVPSSGDLGVTVTFSPVCPAHEAGWWDGADWDGSHLHRPL